ncbi:hypothetical protein GXP67_28560 [Rhodocytophaga rosea]|uniref:SMI1/KNR4 family protein n=1 Tax=Rhodocytophaga rosea TaxID=2704465 RepID=A0A6C0GR35_9BACT|nr:hypothetical protein [Rhodocytophaga rosea]QHT70324.1 hypothetical protein GXP67_28560 [Rhodocytophaga rosea]
MNYEQIKTFVGLSDCSQGYSLKELLHAEKRLNRLLPISLRKYYQCFGKDALLTNAFHKLVNPLEISFQNGYIVFYEENQGVWVAGFQVEKLPAEDTSVWLTYDHGQSWEKFCDKLSEFLISMSFFRYWRGGIM